MEQLSNALHGLGSRVSEVASNIKLPSWSKSNTIPEGTDPIPVFLLDPKPDDKPRPINDCIVELSRTQPAALLDGTFAVTRLIHVKSPMEEEWLHEGVVLEVTTPKGVRYVGVDRVFGRPVVR